METWLLSKAATLISHSSLLQWVARLLSFALMNNKKRDWPKTDIVRLHLSAVMISQCGLDYPII